VSSSTPGEGDCAPFGKPGELPGAGVVDLWLVPLADWPEPPEAWSHALSAEERSRASRYHFPHDAQCFMRCRAALRALLGRYLALSPSELVFRSGRFGKPRLETPLHFNVSHSQDLALMAFTTVGPAGVDLEAVTHDLPAVDLATYFTDSESNLVCQADSHPDQIRTFLRLWTRKEAVLKAAGCGLSMPLHSIDVSAVDCVLEVVTDFGLTASFRVEDLSLPGGFVGAVAAPVESRLGDIRYFGRPG